VSDTGQGIPFELKEKVFDNFYQVDHLNTRKFEGTGLGLSISKSLVRTLGGDIWVDSENGQGTTVFFTVPVEEPS
jgi:two-component system sensor histidine kinase VicK